MPAAHAPPLPSLGDAPLHRPSASERLAAELATQLGQRSSKGQGPEQRQPRSCLQEAASGDATGTFDSAEPLVERASIRGTKGKITPEPSNSKGPLGERASLSGPGDEEWQRHETRVSRDTLARRGPKRGQAAAEATMEALGARHQSARHSAASSANLPPSPPGEGREGSEPRGHQRWETEVPTPGQTAAQQECGAGPRTAPAPKTPTPGRSQGAGPKVSTQAVESGSTRRVRRPGCLGQPCATPQ